MTSSTCNVVHMDTFLERKATQINELAEELMQRSEEFEESGLQKHSVSLFHKAALMRQKSVSLHKRAKKFASKGELVYTMTDNSYNINQPEQEIAMK